MSSVKLNKKHLFSFVVTLVLLFSLNLNVFASTSNTVCFADSDYLCTYYSATGADVTCTSTTSVSTSTYVIDSVSYNTSVFKFPSVSANLEKSIISNADLDIYTNTKYKYDFYVKLGNSSGSIGQVNIFIFYYVDGAFNSSTSLYQAESVSTNSWTKVSGSFQTPDLTGNVTCAVMFSFGVYEDSGRYFYLTDAVFTLDDPLLNGTPIGTPSTDDLNGAIEDYENVMNELPSIDGEELDRLLNFDFDSFTSGMSFVRDMFDRTMSVFGFTSVLSFALAIGLATYLIGRKVG